MSMCGLLCRLFRHSVCCYTFFPKYILYQFIGEAKFFQLIMFLWEISISLGQNIMILFDDTTFDTR